MPSSLVDVRDLSVRFSSGGGVLDAVKHVSFSVAKGEIVALVGESGSGKTVSALSIMPRVLARVLSSSAIAFRRSRPIFS